MKNVQSQNLKIELYKYLNNRTLSYISRLIKTQLFTKSNFHDVTKNERKILKEIGKNGFVVIPDFVDKTFCNSCIKDIDWMMKHKKEFVQEFSDLRIFGAEHLSENIMKNAQHDFIKKMADHYIGMKTATAFTLANRINYSDLSKVNGSGGGWHRDSNMRQFKSILYLNDVDENNGAYQILQYSHKFSYLLKDSRISKLTPGTIRFSDEQIDSIINKFPDRLKTITGKAGTLILKDCSCIHRGSPLKSGKRYALTNYIFEKSHIDENLVKHFSPIVSAEKTLSLAN